MVLEGRASCVGALRVHMQAIAPVSHLTARRADQIVIVV